MAKRGRKPQPTYITMWTEAVEGVRQVVIERDSKGMPTEWRLYPTGLGKPYFGTIRPGDVESERKAIAKFERWKATQDGKPWDKEVGEEPLHDTIWVSMFDPRLRDRRTEHLIKTYISRYRDFIRDLILSDCRKAALELDIEQLAWFEQLKAPKPSLPLKEVGEMYFNRTQEMSAHWKRKSERMWKEFVKCIAVKKVADITPEAISQYHDLVYSRFQKDKSPTYVAHRFGSVKAVLSFALTRGKDQEQLQRVLTRCKMLRPPKKRGVDPQPIQPEHFRKMLE